MRRAIVGTWFGKFATINDMDLYPNARARAGMGCKKWQWPIDRLAIGYVCSSCNQVKKEYDKKNNF